MKKIVDYKVIRCEGVVCAITEGWQPHGSAVLNAISGGSLMQPMVKYEEAKEIKAPELWRRHERKHYSERAPGTSEADYQRLIEEAHKSLDRIQDLGQQRVAGLFPNDERDGVHVDELEFEIEKPGTVDWVGAGS